MTKRQTLNKILLLQNEFNKTVVEYIKGTEANPPKAPRPSRIRRQQKRQGLIQNSVTPPTILRSDIPGLLTSPSPSQVTLTNIPGQQTDVNKIPGQEKVSNIVLDKPGHPCNIAKKESDELSNIATDIQKHDEKSVDMASKLNSKLKYSKDHEHNRRQLETLVYKILWKKPPFQKRIISMFENVNKIKLLKMLSEECKERQAMHNVKCKDRCGCKIFETLLQVTEDMCKYAGIVMTSDKFPPQAKDIIKDKSQHTDKNVKMKELEFETKTATSTKADYLEKGKKERTFDDKTDLLNIEILEQRLQLKEAESKRKDKEFVALTEKMKGLESEIIKSRHKIKKEQWKRENNIKQKDEEILCLKKHIEHMQNMNINDLISNQNKRHKEHEEQNLKQKEIHLKQLKKREFMKNSKFCSFCELYQDSESHFCDVFQKFIRVDERNLVFIEGTTQDDVLPTANDDVQPTAKDEKTLSSRIINTYPNKTSMFNELLKLKQTKIKVKLDMAEIMKQGEDKKKQEEMKKQQEEEENKQKKKEMEKEQKIKEEELKASHAPAKMSREEQRWEKEKQILTERMEKEIEMENMKWKKIMEMEMEMENRKWKKNGT